MVIQALEFTLNETKSPNIEYAKLVLSRIEHYGRIAGETHAKIIKATIQISELELELRNRLEELFEQ